jgi:hypothetical protein
LLITAFLSGEAITSTSDGSDGSCLNEKNSERVEDTLSKKLGDFGLSLGSLAGTIYLICYRVTSELRRNDPSSDWGLVAPEGLIESN